MIIFPVNFKSLLLLFVHCFLYGYSEKVSQLLFLEVADETNFLYALSISERIHNM